ncbi:MAG: serine/threonine-protein kinase [Myxococcota bacterium]|nr:serine/threonine-protein kinase [Myxococcota bacterium]
MSESRPLGSIGKYRLLETLPSSAPFERFIARTNEELGETGQAPNRQELGGTGQAPNRQELGGTGQAPNRQELGGTGQAPNRQETARVELSRLAPPFDTQSMLQNSYTEVALSEARLRSDCITEITEVLQENGSVSVVRPVSEGVLLQSLLGEPRATLAVPVASAIIRACGAALVTAHDAGLYHLAINERVLLIQHGGFVFVKDFAESAVRAQLGGAEEDKLIAPELRRRGELGAGTDVYGLGALLYRLLTGRDQPDEWEPRWTGMMMELAAVGIPGEALRRAMDFFQRCMAERNTQRFPSVRKLLQAFDALVGELEGPRNRSIGVNPIQEWLLHNPLAPRLQTRARRDTIELVDDDDEQSPPPPAAPAPVPTKPLTPMVEASSAEPSRETRILHRSSSGIRALSPQLAQQIGPHPLEILARSRYQVMAELGTGGSGTVYKVLDTTLSEILALKLLRVELTRDPGWLQRFKRELLITRDLEHRNILPSYHLESLDGLFFFTMRYVDGETLHERIRRNGPLNQNEGLRLLIDVGEALRAAHARSIIHRDFKSANIIIERLTEHPYLMDFGIALAPDNPGLTLTGQGIGTPVYMAPEQAMGSTIGPRADIYSFGVVLYETFGGELPFAGSTTVAIYSAQVNAQYRPLQELNPKLPRPLLELVDRCLRPVPEDRPESMKQVLAHLKAIRLH